MALKDNEDYGYIAEIISIAIEDLKEPIQEVLENLILGAQIESDKFFEHSEEVGLTDEYSQPEEITEANISQDDIDKAKEEIFDNYLNEVLFVDRLNLGNEFFNDKIPLSHPSEEIYLSVTEDEYDEIVKKIRSSLDL